MAMRHMITVVHLATLVPSKEIGYYIMGSPHFGHYILISMGLRFVRAISGTEGYKRRVSLIINSR